jgi:hypothetical protein
LYPRRPCEGYGVVMTTMVCTCFVCVCVCTHPCLCLSMLV